MECQAHQVSLEIWGLMDSKDPKAFQVCFYTLFLLFWYKKGRIWVFQKYLEMLHHHCKLKNIITFFKMSRIFSSPKEISNQTCRFSRYMSVYRIHDFSYNDTIQVLIPGSTRLVKFRVFHCFMTFSWCRTARLLLIRACTLASSDK